MALAFQVVFDCLDPAKLAPFWAAILEYKIQDPPSGYDSWNDFLASLGVPEEERNAASAIVDPEGKKPRIFFQQVKEPKQVKNRVHLDVNITGDAPVSPENRKKRIRSSVEQMVKMGATKKAECEENGEFWIVMQDPEGNEFCLQ